MIERITLTSSVARRRMRWISFRLIAGIALTLAPGWGSAEQTRRFEFEYQVTIPASPDASVGNAAPGSGNGREQIPQGESHIDLFLPVATNSTGQEIVHFSVESPYEGQVEEEKKHGNRFWRTKLPASRPTQTAITLRYEVLRSVVRAGDEPGDAQAAKQFLKASERVAVDHPILDPVLAEIRAQSPGMERSARARAIYDWVVENVEYKKVGTGWGNGDTFWACNERYGNCTDFHSLFISLARTEKIPARFEIGFPIPLDREAGTIQGYHCWVEFWLPEAGWVPIDASEAFKHPEKRELYYGTHPADRIQLTTGRDLRLGAAHTGRPLNYFVYPYTESRGKPVDLQLQTRFHYRDVQEKSVGGSARSLGLDEGADEVHEVSADEHAAL